MSPSDMQCDGAIVVMRDDGSISVAVWVASPTHPDRPSIRYSYKIDAQGNYILGSARYSRKSLEDLLRGLSTPPTDSKT